MKPEVKKKLLKALRSGEYRKGKGQLVIAPGKIDEVDGTKSKSYRFCCLGVLTNLYCLEENKTFYGEDFAGGFTNDKVSSWAGLKDQYLDDVQTDLASINDENNTFTKVIKYIEKEL